jgi:hypothetical protein
MASVKVVAESLTLSQLCNGSKRTVDVYKLSLATEHKLVVSE